VTDRVRPPAGPWRWYWLFLILVGFGVPEAVAIAKRREDNTFSYAWQTWLATWRRGARLRWQRGVTFLAFWFGLGIHFWKGWPAWPYLIAPAIPLSLFVVLSMFVWKEK
jgi:hypothetical protein